MAEFPNRRFAVGAFDSWDLLGAALHDLRVRGVTFDNLNCLALHRTFGRKNIRMPWPELANIQELAFRFGREPIACSLGSLNDCLAERFHSGASSLKDALGYWLLPRHAVHLQELVDRGKILLWIRLTDAENECRACQSLLAKSSDTVSVHELAVPVNRSSR